MASCANLHSTVQYGTLPTKRQWHVGLTWRNLYYGTMNETRRTPKKLRSPFSCNSQYTQTPKRPPNIISKFEQQNYKRIKLRKTRAARRDQKNRPTSTQPRPDLDPSAPPTPFNPLDPARLGPDQLKTPPTRAFALAPRLRSRAAPPLSRLHSRAAPPLSRRKFNSHT